VEKPRISVYYQVLNKFRRFVQTYVDCTLVTPQVIQKKSPGEPPKEAEDVKEVWLLKTFHTISVQISTKYLKRLLLMT
jgi:hypothetical protein